MDDRARLAGAAALAAALLALASCRVHEPDRPSGAQPRSTYTFAPPADARGCNDRTGPVPAPGEPAGCTRYRALVARGAKGPATVADLEAMRALCAEGVLDACDHGLLLVAICSEQEVPVDPACVHLARRGELPPPEPTWREVAVPPAWIGCFELLPAEGPHARELAPGGVFCLSPDGVLAVRPPPVPAGIIGGAGGEVDAFRVRVLGERRVVRRGLGVEELPHAELDVVALGHDGGLHRRGDVGDDAGADAAHGTSAVQPVVVSLLAGSQVKTAYAVMPARRLDPAELARLAPGLDRRLLDETCARARDCLARTHARQVAQGEASGMGWDGAPPEVPSSYRACVAVAATCER